MFATRRLVGGAAILACLVLVGGIRPTAAGQNPAQPADPDDKVATEAVNAIAAANALIEYGLLNEKPLAIIAGVETIWENPGETKPANPKRQLTVEGASEEKPDADLERKQLLGYLQQARKHAKGNETYLTAAKDLEERINKGRGTRNGSTKWEGIIDPTKKGVDKATVIRRLFIGGQVGRITITKELNTNIPLNVKLFDGDGNQVASRPGHPLQFEFSVPRKGGDQTYRLEIRNYHSRGVQVRVDTN